MTLERPPVRGRRWSLAALVWALLVLAAPPVRGGEQETDDPSVLVLAASSLTGPLTEIASRWEAESGADLRVSFGGSSRLATKISEGARADVFVSADRRWVRHLADDDHVVASTRRTFASNRIVWVVPAGAPSPPANLQEAASSPPERLALGGPNVPAGTYARGALREAGVWRRLSGRVVSAESVKRALQWVALGEADAGIVYRSDAAASDGVATAFAFPDRLQPEIHYEAAVLRSARDPDAAAQFVEFLGDPAARDVLRRAEFTIPENGGSTSRPRPANSPESTVDEWSAVRLSLVVGLGCLLGGLLPAILFGWLLARRRFYGKSILATILLAPLALPPVVTGFVLLRVLGRSGALGSLLESVGLRVPFTTLGAGVAAFAVSFPLFLLAARSAFELVDPRFEEVARTLGSRPRTAFWRVTLPLALPGLAAGALLTFARAIGEFGATAVLAGNVRGETQTIPLAIYTMLEAPGGYDAIWTLVGISLALSLLAVLGFEWFNRRQRRRLQRSD